MKRIFALCLVLALLAGCAPAPSAPSSGAPASSQTVQEPPAPTFAVGVLDTVQWSGYGTLITNWLCWPRTPPGRTALPGAYPCFCVRITLR